MIAITFRISGTAKVSDLNDFFESLSRLEAEGETVDLTLSASTIVDPEKEEN